MQDSYVGIAVPEILIPNEKINLKKWAVIACDQYTANPQYWADVERLVGNNPSMLHVILPECYLKDQNVENRIAHIKAMMRDYLEEGILKLLPPGFMLVERTVGGKQRKGLLVCVDLDEYDFDLANKPSIRPTEETILERIPPRMGIRSGADLESPHIIVLMDDAQRTVIEPLYAMREQFPLLYDFELMANGGQLKGYFIDNKAIEENILQALANLPTHDGMRFCVGDGNHSLATAKAIWEQAKKVLPEEELAESPLRYAMVELIDLNDDGLSLEPIHRILYNLNAVQCLQYIVEKLNARGRDAKLVYSRRKMVAGSFPAKQNLFFTGRESAGRIEIRNPQHPLLVGEIQPILDEYLKENPSVSIDYIHGEEELERLADDYDTLGFYMPALKKETFFDLVNHCGVLPRKSFSLGSADEKRFYMECRLLTIPAEEEEEPIPEESEEMILETTEEEPEFIAEDASLLGEEEPPVQWEALEEISEEQE